MKRPAIAAALLAGVVAGCAIGPAHPVHAPLLQAQSTGLAATPMPAIDAQWWQAFGDPQLDRLVQAALADNPSLADAVARLRIARSAADVAGSALGPTVRGAIAEQREHLSSRYIYPPPYGGSTYWDGTAGGTLSWNLDFWGRQHDRIAAAGDEARAGSIALRGARLAIESALVGEYVELDRAYAQRDLARAVTAARERLDGLVRARVGAGLDSGIEQRAARAAVDDARVDEREAQSRIELAVHRLAAIAGRGADYYASIGRPALQADPALPLPATLPADLLLRRGDVGVALARVEASSARAHATRLAAYPDINLLAFAGFAAFGLRDLLSAPSRSIGAGLGVGLPIYDGGRLRAETAGANAAVDVAIADYNATVLAAVREAADQLTTLDALARQLADARNRAASVDEALRLVRRRRDAGLSSDVAVVDAELRVHAARRALINLEAADRQAHVALVAALGGSPQDPPSSSKTDAKDAP